MDTPYRAPTLRGLFTLAWPVILARAAQSVVGFTDAVFVASLGPDALAATGNGALNAFAVFMLPLGVAFIVQSFAAQLHGGGDVAKLRRYGWYGLGLAGLAQVATTDAMAAPRTPIAGTPRPPWMNSHASGTLSAITRTLATRPTRVFPWPPNQLPRASVPTAAPTPRSRIATYSAMSPRTAGV